MYAEEQAMTEISLPLAAAMLPKRRRDAHKGDFGRLLIVAGSVGLFGAALMTARAAVRSGAGLTYLAVPEALCNTAVLACPEAMAFPRSLDAVLERAAACDVCAVGPGLGRSEESALIVTELIRRCKSPLVIDADGINILSEHIDILSECQAPIVVTPHEGEFRRLAPALSGSAQERALTLAERYGITVVLKGSGTVCAFADGSVYVNTTGNPGMAKGGSGDVLTGILGALWGQMDLKSAVTLGVFLHGLAGDIAASEKSEYGMIASDIIEALPAAFLSIEAYRDRNNHNLKGV
jgi:NAD(P)H-hydrate epimerase